MKRITDIVFILISLPVILPVFIVIYFLVRINLNTPVFYSQVRPGLYGRPFLMYKFRTMDNRTDEFGKLLTDEKRLSTFGKILRSTSLDELPELWNVIKGDMSLVGPRPLLMEYLELYNEEQMRRHEVKPGITGWAQVNGRNAITWEQKFKLDVWYVDNCSIYLDIKIIFFTIKKVLLRQNITQSGQATTSKFNGK